MTASPEDPIKAFKELWEEERKDPQGFWERRAEEAWERGDVVWFRRWERTFEWIYPRFSWFVGGKTNVAYNCLDVKLQRYGGKPAYIYHSPELGLNYSITYDELASTVRRYAAALRGAGVERGDRVLVYMPNSVEAAAMMLACARIGAISCTVFSGFSSEAVADRIELTTPKLVLTQDFLVRRGKDVPLKQKLDKALERFPGMKVTKVVKSVRPSEEVEMKENDLTLEEFLRLGEGESHEMIETDASDPIFVMPTSGTTAKPKPVVHVHGGYQIWNYWTAKWVYGLGPDDVVFNTSDIGWIVGQSYIVFGPLLAGATAVIYDGTPDHPHAGVWWEAISKYRATLFWTSPTGLRMLRRFGTELAREYDLSSVKRVAVAGEVLNPEVWRWLQVDVFENRIPVIDHMWQTETTGALFGYPYGIGGNSVMRYIKPGSAGLPLPGVDPVIYDESGREELPRGQKGVLYLRRPFPGLTPTLWDSFERYVSSYWEVRVKGLYCTGDAAMIDEDGYVWFSGRADEIIKISGHRIGTIEVESSLITHPAVAEAGVCGVPDELRGEVVAAFVVLKPGYSPSEELKRELIQHVRDTLGPIVVIRDLRFVNMLPKTRSGKIMRRVMRRLWLGQELGDLSTLEEEASVEEIREAVAKMKEVG